MWLAGICFSMMIICAPRYVLKSSVNIEMIELVQANKDESTIHVSLSLMRACRLPAANKNLFWVY